jgi:hypothetical protein
MALPGSAYIIPRGWRVAAAILIRFKLGGREDEVEHRDSLKRRSDAFMAKELREYVDVAVVRDFVSKLSGLKRRVDPQDAVDTGAGLEDARIQPNPVRDPLVKLARGERTRRQLDLPGRRQSHLRIGEICPRGDRDALAACAHPGSSRRTVRSRPRWFATYS